MNLKSRFSTYFAIFAAILILVGSASSTAFANDQSPTGVDDTLADLQPAASVPTGEAPIVPGGPGYIMVPGWSFLPNVPASTTNSFDYGSMTTTAASDANFHTSFSLPNNVVITKITLYYTDNDANSGKYVAVALRYNDYCAVVKNQVARAASDTADALPDLRTVSTAVANLAVDQRCTTYTLIAYLPVSANLWLHAVRIDYSSKTSLPLIAK